MTKREVYKEILDTVSGICEVSVEDILCGLTYTNTRLQETVMVIGEATSPEEFFNSLTHESRHLEAHIAQTLNLDPYGEDICYVSGEIAEKLLPTANEFLH